MDSEENKYKWKYKALKYKVKIRQAAGHGSQEVPRFSKN